MELCGLDETEKPGRDVYNWSNSLTEKAQIIHGIHFQFKAIGVIPTNTPCLHQDFLPRRALARVEDSTSMVPSCHETEHFHLYLLLSANIRQGRARRRKHHPALPSSVPPSLTECTMKTPTLRLSSSTDTIPPTMTAKRSPATRMTLYKLSGASSTVLRSDIRPRVPGRQLQPSCRNGAWCGQSDLGHTFIRSSLGKHNHLISDSWRTSRLLDMWSASRKSYLAQQYSTISCMI